MSTLKVVLALLCFSMPLQAQEWRIIEGRGDIRPDDTASMASQGQSQDWQQQDRIDLRPDGQPATSSGGILDASISDDGRWVIFVSSHSDLVAGDSNGVYDVFVRDRLAHTTRRLSVRPDGSQASGSSYQAHASSDGRFVSFLSGDDSLVTGDTNYRADVFLLDRDADGNGVFDETGGTSLRRMSVDDAGVEVYSGVDSVRAAVSDNGAHLAFATGAKIDSADSNGKSDVYLRDTHAERTPVMSISSTGAIGDKRSPSFFRPPIRISTDGRFVAYSSEATNLVANDTNYATDVFVHDRDTDGNGIFDESGGTDTVRANVGPGNSQIASPDTFARFDMDPTGRWIAFGSHDDLTGGDANPGGDDIYLHQLETGAIGRIDFVAAQWVKGSDSCCGNQIPLVSRHADVVIFRSSQLYSFSPGSTSSFSDVFVWSRAKGLVRLTDYPAPSESAGGYSAGPLALSGNGTYALVSISSTGPATAAQAGTYVYARDTIFVDSFEARTVP